MDQNRALKQIAEKLNNDKVCWALGGSLMLKYYGIVSHANDIDILVTEKDIRKTIDIFQSFGEGGKAAKKAPFRSSHFYQYKVGQTNVDIMAGLALQHDSGIYRLIFNKRSIAEGVFISGEKIPLSAPEDWYVLYQLMPNKGDKTRLIESYFKREGVTNDCLFKQALKQNLPKEVGNAIENVLKTNHRY